MPIQRLKHQIWESSWEAHHSLFSNVQILRWLYKRSVTTVTRVSSWYRPSIWNGIFCSCSTKWHTWRCCIRFSKNIYKGQSHGCFSRDNYYRSKNRISTNFARQCWTREWRKYYCRTVFIPFLDCLLQQVNDRFQGRTKDTIKGMYLIPSNLSDVDKKVKHIKRYHGNDLPNENGLMDWSKKLSCWSNFGKKEQKNRKDSQQHWNFRRKKTFINCFLT